MEYLASTPNWKKVKIRNNFMKTHDHQLLKFNLRVRPKTPSFYLVFITSNPPHVANHTTPNALINYALLCEFQNNSLPPTALHCVPVFFADSAHPECRKKAEFSFKFNLPERTQEIITGFPNVRAGKFDFHRTRDINISKAVLPPPPPHFGGRCWCMQEKKIMHREVHFERL